VVVALVVLPDGLQQRERADQVGLDEGGGVVQRVVVVGFGGEVHDDVGVGDEPVDEVGVTHVADHERDTVGRQPLERRLVSRVGEGVENDDPMLRVIEKVPNEVSADESGAAGHEIGPHAEHHKPRGG